MSEMIERIARILHGQDSEMPYGEDDLPPPASGYPSDKPCWTLYLDHAREILEAMREPTAEMRQAYFEASGDRFQDNGWERAISAALSQPLSKEEG